MSYQLWQDISFYLNEINQEKAAFGNGLITPELIETAKNKISTYLDQLKTSLELKLGKEHSSLILFAIVAAVDEEMQGFNYNHLKARWTPLQKDFYSAYTAGEVFFKTIDEILDNPTMPSLVFETFYFMLKSGFKGKYRDSKTQLAKYADLLREKIHIVQHASNQAATEELNPYRKSKMGKWQYYGLAFSVLAVTYLGLFVFSNTGS
jgi:type IV/VI secretion system ImpK/VasF family protein